MLAEWPSAFFCPVKPCQAPASEIVVPCSLARSGQKMQKINDPIMSAVRYERRISWNRRSYQPTVTQAQHAAQSRNSSTHCFRVMAGSIDHKVLSNASKRNAMRNRLTSRASSATNENLQTITTADTMSTNAFRAS